MCVYMCVYIYIYMFHAVLNPRLVSGPALGFCMVVKNGQKPVHAQARAMAGARYIT